MPRRTGVSHATVALFAVIAGSYLKDLLKLYVDAGDIVTHIDQASVALVNRSVVEVTPDTLSVVIVSGTIVTMSFVWGWAYHINVIGE